MPGRINKYGLSDRIPAAIRRTVRRECGFGCVLCGAAIAHYEHFAPPFEEAKEHHADGIAFLCASCHDRKTRGMWSADTVAAARRKPITFRRGCAHDAFDISGPLTLWLGSSVFHDVASIVRTREGESWFSVLPPEEAGGPFEICAEFADDKGNPSLFIDHNEWRVFHNHWDTEVVGATVTVRRGPGDIVLQLTAKPPHGISLDRLRMSKFGVGIEVDRDGQVVIARGGGITTLDACAVQRAEAVFLI